MICIFVPFGKNVGPALLSRWAPRRIAPPAPKPGALCVVRSLDVVSHSALVVRGPTDPRCTTVVRDRFECCELHARDRKPRRRILLLLLLLLFENNVQYKSVLHYKKCIRCRYSATRWKNVLTDIFATVE